MATASWNGRTLAESEDTIVVEGNYYFPMESLHREFFQDSSDTSVCGWKGTAQYYNVVVDGKVNDNAAWYYPDPKPEAEQIKNRVAFWHGVEVTA